MAQAEKKHDGVLIELKGIRKDYVQGKRSFTALKNINLCLPRVGFVAILGPSGSGKTTLLNVLGGLDRFQEGDLLIDGVSTKDFKDSDWDTYRNKYVGFVFQNYNLVTSYSLEKNISLPLALRGASKAERITKAKECLKQVGLGEDLKKKPGELSGGQQQRVAIARALINDPSLILCDEPTGALDSKASVVALDLLKNLSQDRLVLVVTHNEVLAKKYADRIIVVEDGEISSDTNPLNPPETNENSEKGSEKTRMPLLSAVSTSFKNIFLKKGRNIITAVACSIGIIGVSLVLGATNGFRNYVSTVETSVGSSVPITISPTSYSTRSNNRDVYNENNEFPDDGLLRVYDTSYSSYISHQNKFTKEYLDYLHALTDDPNCKAYGTAMSILENRKGLDFHFLTENGDTGLITSVNANRSAGSLGSMLSSYASIPGTIIHELYGDENLLDHYYKVIQGRMPEKADELVLVVDRYNRVEFSTLRYLGILSESNYEELNENKRTISFDDILYSGIGDTKYKEYKCYRNSDYFDLENPYIQTPEQWTDIYLESTSGEGFSNIETLEFKGTHDTNNKKTIKIYPCPKSLQSFYYEDHNAIECKIVGVLRPTEESYLNLMPSSLCYRKELKDEMVHDYETKSKVLADTQKDNWYFPYDMQENEHGELVPTASDGLVQMNLALQNLASSFEQGTLTPESLVSTSSSLLFEGAIRYVCAGAASSSDTGYSFYASKYASDYLNWNKEYGSEFAYAPVKSVTDLFNYYMGLDFFGPEGDPSIIDVLAYMNAYSLISSISIFPSSLSSKIPLKEYLDEWNAGKADADAIFYSDVVSDLTDTIGTMVTVISAALVIFASVSLVVSSVMTSVVSYVSVIERKKEIGVLRSCGARKRDVGRLFETENAIVGFFAGCLGVLVAFLLSLPINSIVKGIYPEANLKHIISIHPVHVLILVGSAILLALISGFIPARIAAKKDPVECLRGE